MLTSYVICDAISLFATRKCQNIRKIDKNSSYWQGKSLYLLNDLRTVNEILHDSIHDNMIFYDSPEAYSEPWQINFFASFH